MIRDLADLETSFQGAGIVFEKRTGSGQFRELLSLFSPNWLSSKNLPVDPETVQGMLLEDLELLWTEGDCLVHTGDIRFCKNLESLIITDWDPGTGDLISLSTLKKLKSLTIFYLCESRIIA